MNEIFSASRPALPQSSALELFLFRRILPPGCDPLRPLHPPAAIAPPPTAPARFRCLADNFRDHSQLSANGSQLMPSVVGRMPGTMAYFVRTNNGISTQYTQIFTDSGGQRDILHPHDQTHSYTAQQQALHNGAQTCQDIIIITYQNMKVFF